MKAGRIPRSVLLVAATTSAMAGLLPSAGGLRRFAPEPIPPDGRFRFEVSWRPPSVPRWGVALSGGGAWGIAHLGLLEAMAEDGLRPDAIAGTSIGALVGAAIAAGYRPDEVEEILRSAGSEAVDGPFDGPLDTERAVLPDPLAPERAAGRGGRTADGAPLAWRGLIPERAIVAALARHLARADALAGGDLDRLAVPFRAVATDLRSGTVHAPRHGSLVTLVRASIGLPFFPPVEKDGMVLVDGGVLEFVPVPSARGMDLEVVVGVRLSASGAALDPFPVVRSFPQLQRRYDAVTLAAQRNATAGMADVLLEVPVGDLPVAGFAGRIDELMAAGRAAWERQRVLVLDALSAAAAAPPVAVAQVRAAEPAAESHAADLDARLRVATDGAGTVEVARLEIELCRLAARAAARPVLQVDPSGEALLWLEPRDRPAGLEEARTALLDLRRHGAFLAGIRLEDGDGGEAAIDPGAVSGVAVDPALAGAADWAGLVGRPADLGAVMRRLEVARARRPALVPRLAGATADGAGKFILAVDSPSAIRWETGWQLGVADTLGPSLWWGWSRANRAGGWGLETRVAASREGGFGGFQAKWDDGLGGSPWVRLVGGHGEQLLFTENGGWVGADGFTTAAAGGGLAWALAPGLLEVGVMGRWADGRAVAAREGRSGADAGLMAALGGGWGTRSRRVDVEWSGDGYLPLAGEERTWSTQADVGVRVRPGRAGLWSAAVLGRIAASGDEPLPLDRFADLDGWWVAPGITPARGRAAALRRATVVVHRRLGFLGPFPVAGGVSAAAWHLGAHRVDERLDAEGYGGSIFLEARLPRVGSLVLGYARGSEEGDSVFLLLGPGRIGWPGNRAALPGR